MKKLLSSLTAVIFVSLVAITGIANATTWSKTFNHPAFNTHYVLDLTTIAPNFVPGLDSLTTAFLTLDYDNGAAGNHGTATFSIFSNGNLTGTLAFGKNQENTPLALPANTLADLGSNGKIDFSFSRDVGSHSFDLNSAAFVVNGTHNTSTNTSSSSVPEPGTIMLLSAGFLGLIVYGKSRKHS